MQQLDYLLRPQVHDAVETQHHPCFGQFVCTLLRLGISVSSTPVEETGRADKRHTECSSGVGAAASCARAVDRASGSTAALPRRICPSTATSLTHSLLMNSRNSADDINDLTPASLSMLSRSLTA